MMSVACVPCSRHQRGARPRIQDPRRRLAGNIPERTGDDGMAAARSITARRRRRRRSTHRSAVRCSSWSRFSVNGWTLRRRACSSPCGAWSSSAYVFRLSGSGANSGSTPTDPAGRVRSRGEAKAWRLQASHRSTRISGSGSFSDDAFGPLPVSSPRARCRPDPQHAASGRVASSNDEGLRA